MQINELWIIWGIGFLTGGMGVYLGCILFMRRMLREEGELMRFLTRKETITRITTYEGNQSKDGKSDV